jgi:hypothetical protein
MPIRKLFSASKERVEGWDGIGWVHVDGRIKGPGWLKWAPPDHWLRPGHVQDPEQRRQRLILDAGSPEPEVRCWLEPGTRAASVVALHRLWPPMSSPGFQEQLATG